MEIQNHLLTGKNVSFVKSPNHSGPFKPGALDTVVMHYTAAPSVKSAVGTLTNPRVKSSAHIVVGRDGSVVQLVPFNIISWHAGQSSYQGRVGLNNYSIGIEMDNAGILTKSGNTYMAWFGGKYESNDVIQAIHRNEREQKYWHAYTEEQMDVLEEICTLLIDNYHIKLILGHEEIAPGRKLDPGPAFPLDRFRNNLLYVNRDDDYAETVAATKRVSVSKLNVRENPIATAATVTEPLLQGTKVQVLEEKNGWYKVKVEKSTEGWVGGQFVQKV